MIRNLIKGALGCPAAICILVVIIVFVFSFLSSVTAFAMTDDSLIRVGLSHSSGPMLSVNALAETGYDLGYFDGNTFVRTATISNRYVSFCVDTTLYTDGRTVSSTGTGEALKPYHLEVERSFSSQEEAADYISRMRTDGYVGEVFPAFIGDAIHVRVEHYSREEYARADIGRIKTYTKGDDLRVVGNNSRVITVLDLNNLSIACEIEPPSGCWPAARAADGSTIRNSVYNYNGAFEFRRIDGGHVTFLNTLRLSDYLKGVLPYEMSGSWHIEALKAQALCARSYALFNRSRHTQYDICNTTHCQVYYGTSRETELVRAAVVQTENEVVAWNGKLISTYYFSSSGGHTESSVNAWGGTEHPYYAAVPDPYEKPEEITTYSRTLTTADLTALVNDLGAGIGSVTNVYVSKYTEIAGNVYEVTFVGSSGRTYSVSRTDNVRIRLNSIVRSPRFDIFSGLTLTANEGVRLTESTLYAVTGDEKPIRIPALPHILSAEGVAQPEQKNDGTFTFAGAGFGHNVGMSQYGAKGMAEAGYTYRDIIHHYFTGVEIMRTDTMG